MRKAFTAVSLSHAFVIFSLMGLPVGRSSLVAPPACVTPPSLVSSQLMPFLWPEKNTRLRAHIVTAFVLLLSVRVLNIYVPIYQKIIVDDLAVSIRLAVERPCAFFA